MARVAVNGEHNLGGRIRGTNGPLLASLIVVAHIAQDVVAAFARQEREVNLFKIKGSSNGHRVTAIETQGTT